MTREHWTLPGVPWRAVLWGLQVLLAVAVAWGLVAGQSALAVNAAVGLTFTILPGVFRRLLGVAVPTPLVAWVALAAALHAGGMVLGLYVPPTGFDLLTHAVSGSVVGSGTVAVVRTWEHREDDLHLTVSFLVAVVLLTVMAGGVVWEVVEFAIATRGPATQHGIADTVTDLLANLAGGVVALLLWPTPGLHIVRGPLIDFSD